jgi:hypothetical protein
MTLPDHVQGQISFAREKVKSWAAPNTSQAGEPQN